MQKHLLPRRQAPLDSKPQKNLANIPKRTKINLKDPFTTEDYYLPSSRRRALLQAYLTSQTGKCMVHPVKPETCVAGPVTFNINFCTKKVEWFLKTKELCAFAGVLFEDKAAFKEHFEVAKSKLLRLLSN